MSVVRDVSARPARLLAVLLAVGANKTVAREETMISFALAQELKAAGFSPSTSPHAIYALSDHLRIRREHALLMWYGSKSKAGVPLQLDEEAVYTPILSDLVVACGKPLRLSSDEAGVWRASKSPDEKRVDGCESAEEALGRLWLLMRASI
jgi:hypothetical protein